MPGPEPEQFTHPGEILLEESGIQVPDFVSQVKKYFEEFWVSGNTDGYKPEVRYAELSKDIDFEDGDHITLFTGTINPQPHYITHSRETIIETVTMEFLTSGERPHWKKLVAEAKRIIQSKRNDFMGTATKLTGRLWAEWGPRDTPPTVTKKKMYHSIADATVHWVDKEIQT